MNPEKKQRPVEFMGANRSAGAGVASGYLL